MKGESKETTKRLSDLHNRSRNYQQDEYYRWIKRKEQQGANGSAGTAYDLTQIDQKKLPPVPKTYWQKFKYNTRSELEGRHTFKEKAVEQYKDAEFRLEEAKKEFDNLSNKLEYFKRTNISRYGLNHISNEMKQDLLKIGKIFIDGINKNNQAIEIIKQLHEIKALKSDTSKAIINSIDNLEKDQKKLLKSLNDVNYLRKYINKYLDAENTIIQSNNSSNIDKASLEKTLTISQSAYNYLDQKSNLMRNDPSNNKGNQKELDTTNRIYLGYTTIRNKFGELQKKIEDHLQPIKQEENQLDKQVRFLDHQIDARIITLREQFEIFRQECQLLQKKLSKSIDTMTVEELRAQQEKIDRQDTDFNKKIQDINDMIKQARTIKQSSKNEALQKEIADLDDWWNQRFKKKYLSDLQKEIQDEIKSKEKSILKKQRKLINEVDTISKANELLGDVRQYINNRNLENHVNQLINNKDAWLKTVSAG